MFALLDFGVARGRSGSIAGWRGAAIYKRGKNNRTAKISCLEQFFRTILFPKNVYASAIGCAKTLV